MMSGIIAHAYLLSVYLLCSVQIICTFFSKVFISLLNFRSSLNTLVISSLSNVTFNISSQIVAFCFILLTVSFTDQSYI